MPEDQDQAPEHDRSYELVVSKAGLAMAGGIAEREDSESRTERMQRVVVLQRDILGDEFQDVSQAQRDRPLGEDFAQLSRGRARTCLIDLAFDDPFAPYEFSYDKDYFWQALADVAVHAESIEDSFVNDLRHTRRSAMKAHRSLDLKKLIVLGGGGLLVGLAGGAALAPFVGAAIGSSAGLYGAAATLHGLATIGGGAVAAGGLGVAGGTWLVAGAGAAGAAGVASTVNLLRQLSAESAEVELIKFQVTYALVVKPGLAEDIDQTSAITAVVEAYVKLGAVIEDEKGLNDPKSDRIGRLKAIRGATDRALRWIQEQ